MKSLKKLILTIMLFACVTATANTPISYSENADNTFLEPLYDLENPY